jgi:hypothetical protein
MHTDEKYHGSLTILHSELLLLLFQYYEIPVLLEYSLINNKKRKTII